MQVSVVVALACAAAALAVAEGGVRPVNLVRPKQPRAARGFMPDVMMTARGFGKRAASRNELLGLGSTDNFWDLMEASQARNAEQFDGKAPESIPVEWFAEELFNNPELIKTVIRKFVDTNQDGVLSPDELLRNVY